jgi:autotransporter-associated beta strand protein
MKTSPFNFATRLALVMVALAITPAAFAQNNGTWSNVGTDWNTAANWVGSTLPGTNNAAIFSSKVTQSPNLSSSVSIGRITTGSSNFDAGSFSISSSATNITLTLTTASSGTSSAINYTDNANNTLTISAPVILGAAANANQSVNVANAGSTVLISGVISGTGSQGLIKSGSGNLALSGANTYTGGTTISAGALELRNGGSVAGNITNNAALSLNRTDIATVANTISGSGSLSKSGAGTTTLTAANTYSGGTTIAAGVLELGTGGSVAGNITNNAALSFNRTDSATVTNTISGSGSLSKAGAGTLTLSVSNSYSGGTTLQSGTLRVDNNAAMGTGTLTLENGTTFSAASVNRAIANNMVINGDVSFNEAGTGQLTLQGTNINLGGVNRRLTVNTTTVVGQANSLVTTAGFTKDGAGLLNINPSQNYSGSTILEAGTLTGNSDGAFGSSTLVLRGGTLASANANARTWSNAVSIQGDVVLTEAATRTGAITLSGAVDLGNTIRTLTVNTNATLSGVVGGIGGGLTKAGNGTLTLSNANTYTGATTIGGGTLLVATSGSIASSSATVNSGGLLKVNGTAGAITVNSGGSLGGSGSVGAVTLTSGSALNPGNSPGLLTATSATWAAGSTYNWEINSNATNAVAGTNWDLFSVTGSGVLDMSALSSGATMNLVLNSLSGFDLTSSINRTWVIAQAGSLLGTGGAVLIAGANVSDYFNINATAFTSVTPSLVNEWRVEVGDTGKTLNLMAIPEPSTGSMFGLGLAGLVVTRLLRRKSS